MIVRRMVVLVLATLLPLATSSAAHADDKASLRYATFSGVSSAGGGSSARCTSSSAATGATCGFTWQVLTNGGICAVGEGEAAGPFEYEESNGLHLGGTLYGATEGGAGELVGYAVDRLDGAVHVVKAQVHAHRSCAADDLTEGLNLGRPAATISWSGDLNYV